MKEREMLSFEEALERVLTHAPSPRPERIELAAARGRVLAEDILCERDVPAADVSAMDGFGVRAADLEGPTALALVGDALAGSPFDGRVEPGQCTRVMTGGLIPEGCDAVVPVELSSGYEPDADGTVRFERASESGANIRPRGSVRAAGDRLLAVGDVLRPARIAVLAQQGRAQVSVYERPRVAVLPTGDEVVEIDEVPNEGQVRNSNAYSLEAQVVAAGADAHRLPILRDVEGETVRRLRDALATHDLVCTIGGVSMGTRDLVRAAFEELGGETIVESTRIKPGKPTLFGAVEIDGRNRYLLGLPGNPASSYTIFELFGAPWIRRALGREDALSLHRAQVVEGSVRKNWRLQLVPARLDRGGETPVLRVLEQRSSADLFSLGDSDVLVLSPAEQATGPGDEVSYLTLP